MRARRADRHVRMWRRGRADWRGLRADFAGRGGSTGAGGTDRAGAGVALTPRPPLPTVEERGPGGEGRRSKGAHMATEPLTFGLSLPNRAVLFGVPFES